MKKEIKIIKKCPGEPSREITIPNTLEAFQKAVGGFIESVTMCTDMAIICNEEGLIMGLPYNCSILGHTFVGTILAVGIKGDEFTDFPGTLEGFERYWL